MNTYLLDLLARYQLDVIAWYQAANDPATDDEVVLRLRQSRDRTWQELVELYEKP